MGVQISGDTGNVLATKGTYTGNLTVGGVLTYEDVTNVDSVGLITARSGIEIGARPGVAASISVDGNMIVSGISTFGGDIQVPDKIIHAGDTNTALRFPAADTITAETGGSERLRITSAGYVGINQSSPGTGLHVSQDWVASYGSISAEGSANALVGMGLRSNGSYEAALIWRDGSSGDYLELATQNSNPILFKTANTERLRIDGSNLRFAVTNAQIELQTSDGSDNGFLNLSGGGACSQGRGAQVVCYGNDYTDYQGTLMLLAGQSGNTNGVIQFYTSGSEVARITSDGKFGFGTNSPDQTVHIQKGDASASSTANTVLTLENSTTNVLQFLNPNNTAAQVRFGDPQDNGAGYIEYSHDSNMMSFGTNGPTKLQLNHNGNLFLRGSSANYLVMGSSGDATSGGVTNNMNWIRGNSTNTQLNCAGGFISFEKSGTEIGRFQGDDFLVGTTNASSSTGVGLKLNYDDTNPTFNCVINQSSHNHSFYHLYNTNATHNAYRFYVQVNGGIANYQSNNVDLSDERMKKNITNMGSVYDTFKKFTFKDFNYIDDEASESKKHGLIAQDVETIDSDLITEDFKIAPDSEGNDVYRKALKTEQFMMIGMKALQEAMTKIETLEAEVAALKGS